MSPSGLLPKLLPRPFKALYSAYICIISYTIYQNYGGKSPGGGKLQARTKVCTIIFISANELLINFLIIISTFIKKDYLNQIHIKFLGF